MAIRVEKPAFNLRSKLNELDYERIPYQKMPYGSVVDIDYAYNNTQSTHTNQNTTCVGPVVISRKDRNNAIWLYTNVCLLYTSPSPRDGLLSRMPSSA